MAGLMLVPGLLEAAVPGQPSDFDVYVDTAQDLRVSWSSPRDGGSDVLHYKVEWKSGNQGYDPARQDLVTPPADGQMIRHALTNLAWGASYTVRVMARSSDGDGLPSVEKTVRLLLQHELDAQLREAVQSQVLGPNEASHPWLRQAWNHLNRHNARVESIAGSGWYTDTCSRTPKSSGLRECQVKRVLIGRPHDGSHFRSVAVHELAHVYTLPAGANSNPEPLAMAHLYFNALARGQDRCPSYELYADIMMILVLPDEDGLSNYWDRYCAGATAGRTSEAMAVVKSALSGRIPSWFTSRYAASGGGLDLERVWADTRALVDDRSRVAVVHQLRHSFGGYCDNAKATESAFGNGVTRNPWRDGGCVPGSPRDLTATPVGDGAVGLTWSIPASDGGSPIEGYKVRWRTQSGTYASSRQVRVDDPAATRHTLSGLRNGTRYQVQILAHNHNGDGSPSSETSLTPTDRDTVAPVMRSASIDGSRVTLEWNEALDEDSVPGTESFAIAVAGATRGIESVAVSGRTVTLILDPEVGAGDAVTASYTVPGNVEAARIRDAAGNPSRSFSGESVHNATTAPPALPVVSIATATAPISEGAAATFTLTRAGAAAGALTVNLGLTESGSMLDGDPPATVTFAEGSTTATLTVGTEDDDVDETDSTVTATVRAGTGYTVSATAGSASVTVADNDEALSDDATLSSLDVSGVDIGTFSGGDTDYAAKVAYTVTSTTVTAAASGEGASVVIADDDGSTTAASRTVTLVEGANTMTITVTAEDGRTTRTYTVTVTRAKPPLTASFENLPETHDGSKLIMFNVRFNAPLLNSYRTLRDRAFTVKGGRVTSAVRVKGSSSYWQIRVQPHGDGEVTIVLEPNRRCWWGPCARPNRRLSNRLAATVAGPDSSGPKASIAAVASPVSEGTGATFTVTLNVAQASDVTVSLSVGETGTMLAGTAPASVTIAAGDASATVTVATEDDDVDETDSTVTATVSAGTGYRVSASAGSATVTVTDDDEPVIESRAPVITSADLFSVPEGATAVATLTAIDEDSTAPELSWSIPSGAAGGADGGMFTLTRVGALAFGSPKDFEAPDDGDSDGTYEVTVSVTDGTNTATAAFEVTLSNVNEAPVADAGTDLAGVMAGTTVTLDAGASADPDVNDTLSHAWTQTDTSGHTVTLSDTVAVKPTFTAPAGLTSEADLTFNLVVTDAAGLTGEDTVNVRVAPLPVVSIAPNASTVTEGSPAVFVLRRRSHAGSPLTVAVRVSHKGAMLDGTPASSVTFAADAAEARLSVATENDAADEADARVSASVSAGNGYRVDASAGSAAVDVLDNDATSTSANETLWSTTLEWKEYGGGWLIANEEDFSSANWSEDDAEYRVWYFAYAPSSGELWLRLNPELPAGGIPRSEELTLTLGDLVVGPASVVADFARGRTAIAVNGAPQGWAAEDSVVVRLTRSTGAEEEDASGPGLAVADAEVREAEGARLVFHVSLSEAQSTAVSVRYQTADGTARAGLDYTGVVGALRFEPGEIGKTIAVPVLVDAHDEDSEALTLTLSAPFGARLVDAEATGTIVNAGPIPRAWIARFGRVAAGHVLEGVEQRLGAAREARTHITLAGQPLYIDMAARDDGSEDDGYEGAARDSLGVRPAAMALESGVGAGHGGLPGGPHERHGPVGPSWGKDDGNGWARPGSRSVSGREALAGTSLLLGTETAGGGFGALWGRGALASFRGDDGGLALEGDVRTLTLGADYAAGRWVAGVALSHSRGEGTWSEEGVHGAIESDALLSHKF